MVAEQPHHSLQFRLGLRSIHVRVHYRHRLGLGLRERFSTHRVSVHSHNRHPGGNCHFRVSDRWDWPEKDFLPGRDDPTSYLGSRRCFRRILSCFVLSVFWMDSRWCLFGWSRWWCRWSLWALQNGPPWARLRRSFSPSVWLVWAGLRTSWGTGCICNWRWRCRFYFSLATGGGCPSHRDGLCHGDVSRKWWWLWGKWRIGIGLGYRRDTLRAYLWSVKLRSQWNEAKGNSWKIIRFLEKIRFDNNFS